MKKRMFIAGLIIILIAILFLVDIQVVKFIQGIRNPLLDYVLISVAFASDLFIVFLFLTVLFFFKKNKRRWMLPLWLSIFLSLTVGFLIKITVKRSRPFQQGIVSASGVLVYFIKNNLNTWNFSFPSFQAMLVFSVLPIINREFRKFKFIWLIFAIFVAFSRVYFGVHYLSDVLTGALIGYLIGYAIVLVEEKYEIGKNLVEKMTSSHD